jgi:hypothetical protein
VFGKRTFPAPVYKETRFFLRHLMVSRTYSTGGKNFFHLKIKPSVQTAADLKATTKKTRLQNHEATIHQALAENMVAE